MSDNNIIALKYTFMYRNTRICAKMPEKKFFILFIALQIYCFKLVDKRYQENKIAQI